MADVITLDLDFLGRPHVVAAYLLKHAKGGVLVECGPSSTLPALQRSLSSAGLQLQDISDVLLTHIHLDHAGAAGWFARHAGARIHVHANGAPHLLNPEKLLVSAKRIYGAQMDALWGDFLPVPAEQLVVLQDGQTLEVGDLRFEVLDTPGHAEHHLAYVHEDLCFVGDVGGIRLPGPAHLRVPMPPPEFQLEKWRASVRKLQERGCRRVAPTHFGIYDDADWHFQMLARALGEVEEFMLAELPGEPALEQIRERFQQWTADRSRREGLPDAAIAAYESANPSGMSATGMQRYWAKYRRGS